MEGNPIAGGLSLLAEFLEREKRRGREFLHLSSETERVLEQLPAFLMSASLEEPRPSAETGSVAPGPETSSARVEPASSKQVEPQSRAPDPADAGSRPAASSPERDEKWVREQLNEIFREVKNSRACRELGTLRDTVVFATGNPCADLMLIGEAPGAEEEKQKKPFVGPAGKKLDRILEAMGLSRDEVYISNIVKYRPRKGDGRFQGSSNRKPDHTEMELCLPFLHREIELVAPKAIVALGGTAAEGLLERGAAIAQLRGQVHDIRGVPVVVTYHPSFLLRQDSEPDPAKAKEMKRRVWEDMLRAMELVGMPISEKQRAFFR